MNVSRPLALVVDDQTSVRRHLRIGLEATGFHVEEAENGTDALKRLSRNQLDLLVLNLQLPDIAGSEVLERLRVWSNTPTIVLTTRPTRAERKKLLQMGADDYLAKPVDTAELSASANTLLYSKMDVFRRPAVVRSGSLEIDLSTCIAKLKGRPVKLTIMEFKLLQILAKHAGHAVSHQHLIEKIWGSTQADMYYLRTLVYKVRRKIEEDSSSPRIVIGNRGIGYRLHQD